MSITGQVGHVVLGKQNAMGVPVSPAASGAIKITGDSLVPNNNPLTAEGEIGVGRDVSQSVPGGFSAAGSLNGNLRARAANLLFEGAFGLRTPGVGVSIDTYTPADDLPLWTIQKKVGSATPELLVLQYQDAMVNTLNVAAPSGALATFSAGVITAGESRLTAAESAGTGLISPTYATTSDDLLVFHGGRIMSGATGASLVRDETFQSVELVFNNNIAADEYTVRPSRFLRSLTEGIRSIETNMTLVFENPDKYSQYTYGAQARTAPGYNFYEAALQIFLGNFQLTNDAQDAAGSTLAGTTFTGATPGAGQALNGTQIVQFNIPRMAFTGLPVALSTGRIVVTTTARALKSGSSNIVTAYVRPTAA